MSSKTNPLNLSVSFYQSLLTSFSNEFLLTVKYSAADFSDFRYSQVPFSASFCSSPTASNSFQDSSGSIEF